MNIKSFILGFILGFLTLFSFIKLKEVVKTKPNEQHIVSKIGTIFTILAFLATLFFSCAQIIPTLTEEPVSTQPSPTLSNTLTEPKTTSSGVTSAPEVSVNKVKSTAILERDLKSYQVKDKLSYKTYPDSQGEPLKMSSIEYKNGFSLVGSGASENTRSNYALFNLQGNYSELKVHIGHVDGSAIKNCTVNFYHDESTIPFDSLDISPENLPIEKALNVSSVNQLKIEVVFSGNEIYSIEIGFGDPTLI